MLIKEKINLDIKGLIENGPITIFGNGSVNTKSDSSTMYKTE